MPHGQILGDIHIELQADTNLRAKRDMLKMRKINMLSHKNDYNSYWVCQKPNKTIYQCEAESVRKLQFCNLKVDIQGAANII